jgi:anti-sigma factor RsiW
MSQESEQQEPAPRDPAEHPSDALGDAAGHPPDALAELSALADGTLDPEREPAVRARIQASPRLSELLERERLAVAALRAARLRDRAPQALRRQLQERPARTRRGASRPALAALAAAAAALIAVLAIALPATAPGGPSLAQAAALAARGPSAPAPAVDPHAPGRSLAIGLGPLRFPNWRQAFGLRAVGSRIDVVDGRRAVTVFYAGGRWRVAYTILAAPKISIPSRLSTRLYGLSLFSVALRGRLVVGWHEDGETCLLQGSGVTVEQLRALAAWTAPSR